MKYPSIHPTKVGRKRDKPVSHIRNGFTFQTFRDQSAIKLTLKKGVTSFNCHDFKA